MRRIHLAFVSALVFAACSPGDRADDVGGDDPGGGPDGGSNFIDATPLPDGNGPSDDDAVVYAHTSTTLFKINPETFELTEIGAFVWPADTTGEAMTDIAIDKSGAITGVSFTAVYSVNGATAKATKLANLEQGRVFNALSWLPSGAIPGIEGEVLVGAAADGSFWRIDPATGVATLQGNYGNGRKSSGDLVSIEGAGTFATIKDGSKERLAKIDPATGEATPIGDKVGFVNVYGLGYWKGKLFGFTSAEQIIVINPTTGAAQLQQTTDLRYWYGAGVTTQAPIIE